MNLLCQSHSIDGQLFASPVQIEEDVKDLQHFGFGQNSDILKEDYSVSRNNNIHPYLRIDREQNVQGSWNWECLHVAEGLHHWMRNCFSAIIRKWIRRTPSSVFDSSSQRSCVFIRRRRFLVWSRRLCLTEIKTASILTTTKTKIEQAYLCCASVFLP